MMCKSIRYTYYCEELFVVKHKSKHSCASAIFYSLGKEVVFRNCHFNYYYNKTVPPVILDGGTKLLSANFHGPRSLKCNSQNGGLSKPAPEHTYAVVPHDFLCDCQLYLEHASILQQLSSCNRTRVHELNIDFAVNVAFYEVCRKFYPKLAAKVKLQVRDKPQSFDLRLTDDEIEPLSRPTHLEDLMIRMTSKEADSKLDQAKEQDSENEIMSRMVNNVLAITCTFY